MMNGKRVNTNELGIKAAPVGGVSSGEFVVKGEIYGVSIAKASEGERFAIRRICGATYSAEAADGDISQGDKIFYRSDRAVKFHNDATDVGSRWIGFANDDLAAGETGVIEILIEPTYSDVIAA